MRQQELHALRDWFVRYTRSFSSNSADDRRNFSLKVEHTREVCKNIVFIAESISLTPEEVLIAEAVGLFHDIGRFPQYARYRTFRDSISVNHGRLGAETLVELKVLQDLPERERDLILHSVTFHNAFSLPVLSGDQHRCFLRLIRDADKLDIWRIFSQYFNQPAGGRATAAGLGLPDLPGYSDTVLSCLFENRSAALADLKTLNDFKLLQLSWAFDLNFRASFVLLQKKGDFYRICNTLPQAGEIGRAVSHVRTFIGNRLHEPVSEDC